MKIIILGAGQVGSSVAESLVSEANDITVVDIDQPRLSDLQNRLDLRTVLGSASHPSVLAEAGAEDADMIIAVTQNDETNLVACKLAAHLFNLPTRIARIRATDYLTDEKILSPECFAVDYSICPEQVLTDYIAKLIEFPEALQVLEFANGKLTLVAVRAFENGPLIKHPLKDLRQHMPQVDARVVAIYRGDKSIAPEGDTIIEVGDEVFCLAATENIRQVMHELRRMDKPVKRVMIAGGGNTGYRVAHTLEKNYQVKIIEHNRKRCEVLSNLLHRALVINGDATDEALLESENLSEMDIFLALTNDDENNIMSALLAKRSGARRVVSLIKRRTYADLVQGWEIDIAISPAHVTMGTVLAHVRRGDVTAVHSLRRGAAEAFEAIAHGNSKSSKVVGRRIEEIDLPKGATIGAIVRGNQVIIAHHDTLIQSGDHVIVFMINKQILPKIEKLFQIGVGFF